MGATKQMMLEKMDNVCRNCMHWEHEENAKEEYPGMWEKTTSGICKINEENTSAMHPCSVEGYFNEGFEPI